MTTQTKTDTDITADVLAELAWDPAVTVADLDVRTSDGHVTLSGTAATYGSKDAAENAAYRVFGVRGVTNNIIVDPSAFGMRADADIRADVMKALDLDAAVPLDRISVHVNNGVVTLEGTLDYYYQRQAAEDDAAQIAGVTGIVNLIAVKFPEAMEDDISARIASAFARSAELSDDHMVVSVDGSTATLSGEVRTWSEYEEAEDAAWRAPGITDVVNHIEVTL